MFEFHASRTAAALIFMTLAIPAEANGRLAEAAKNPDDWVMQLGDYAGHRYSTLDEINEGNVAKLQVAWMFSTGALRGHEGGPLKIGDVMFVHTPFPNKVFALNIERDGYKIVWKYTPRQDKDIASLMCCDTVNRGLAWAPDLPGAIGYRDRGTLYLHQADTSLLALDPPNGKEIWKIANGDPKRGETGTAAPTVVKDKVLVGVSGGEFGVRCHLTAYDAATGKKVWRAYSTGPDGDILFDPEKTTHLGKPVGENSSLTSWRGDEWSMGGGCAWGWTTYDPELDLVYHGTGNPAPWNPKQRPGDNKWTASIMARDVATGVARWVYQATPHDEWGFDSTNEMILADLPAGEGSRRALVQFNQNGFVYALHRGTGELLSAGKLEPEINWAKGIDLDPGSAAYGRPAVDSARSTDRNGVDVNTKNICPSTMGAKGPAPAAYDPKARLFVVPAFYQCMDFEPQNVTHTPGRPYVGGVLSMFPPEGKTNTGKLIGWDAVNGKAAWSVDEPFTVDSGPLVTAGGLAFYGTIDGWFKAVRTSDGKELYRFKVGSGIIGNVMTYRFGGRQYVAVLAGLGGYPGIGLAAGIDRPTDGFGYAPYAGYRIHVDLGGNLVVFALPSSETLKKQ